MELTINPVTASTKVELNLVNNYEPLATIVDKVNKFNIQTIVTIPKHIDELVHLRVRKQGRFKIIPYVGYPKTNIKGLAKFKDQQYPMIDGYEICIPKLKDKNEYYHEMKAIINNVRGADPQYSIRFVLPEDKTAIVDALKELENKPNMIRLALNSERAPYINNIQRLLKYFGSYVQIKPGNLNQKIVDNFGNSPRILLDILPSQFDLIK